MNIAYIGMGSNLGAPTDYLQQALQQLAAQAGIEVIKCSRFYRSSPVDSAGPDYVNAVACLHTTLDAHRLLHVLHHIEKHSGRTRPYRYAPRTLDLDILLFNDDVYALPELIIPHPRMHLRAFVLEPLQEIAPDIRLAQGDMNTLLKKAKQQGQTVTVLGK